MSEKIGESWYLVCASDQVPAKAEEKQIRHQIIWKTVNFVLKRR